MADGEDSPIKVVMVVMGFILTFSIIILTWGTFLDSFMAMKKIGTVKNQLESKTGVSIMV